MEFVLCNELLRDLSLPQQADHAAALGYAGLEVAPFTLEADEPHRMPAHERRLLRRAAEDAGAPILGLHWLLAAPAGLSITSADPALRAQTLEVMQGLIALAADLGAEYLVHGSPGQRVVSAPGDADRANEAMLMAGEWARAVGVTYIIEPLDPSQTNWMSSLAEAVAFTQAAGNPHLATMLDVSAAENTEAEPVPELLRRYVPTGQIAHIHLNDRTRRGPGQGVDRFIPILETLLETGYPGRAGVESFDYLPDGPGTAARAIGYLQGCLEALARRA
jgi:D-psicose/D-tagatose/L-ribulose 3-epimerase